MSYRFNRAVQVQLAHNRAMRKIHGQAQSRLDQMRMSSVARSAETHALIQAGGAARNILAGMLPRETLPKVRSQLAQHAGPFTVTKALRANAKARVLG